MTYRNTTKIPRGSPSAREKTIAQCVLSLVLAFIAGLVRFAPLHVPDTRVAVASGYGSVPH
jgi:hypothetical protein